MAKDFSRLNIRAELVKALHEDGVVEPTPIQEKAIPILLDGQDMIGQAQTGTGKTLAFVLPILEAIDLNKSAVQALIVTPTRELAIQIAAEVKKLAPAVGANVLAAYGGQDVERQIHKLKGDIHIVIGTPGRLLDHLRRGTVNFGKLDQLVLDEADQMLHMGFLAEVEEIIAQTPTRRQTMLFSATMPAPIRSLAKQYMKEPVEIQIEAKRVTLDEIEQVVIETTDRNKQSELVRLIQQHNPYLAMVFCRTKRRAGMLNKALQELGFSSDELHGDLSQAKREQVMKRFREARIQILVATDMAARGIDVEGITHVFNFDIPHDVESYIHRIGRTGRAGKKGMAITFATSHDRAFLEQIERGIQQSLGGNRTQRGGMGRSGEGVGRSAGERGKRAGAGRDGESSGRETGGRERKGGTGRNGESSGRERKGDTGRNGESSGRETGGRERKGGTGRNGESSGRETGGRETGGRERKGGTGRNEERSGRGGGAGGRSGARSDGRRESERGGERGTRGSTGSGERGGSGDGRRSAGARGERDDIGNIGERGAVSGRGRAAGQQGERRLGRDGGDARSGVAGGGRQGSANFGNAASRVRGGAAPAGARDRGRVANAPGRGPRQEGSAAAGAARPLGRRGALAAAKNDVAWGRKPEGDIVEPKRGDRAWAGSGAATEQRSARSNAKPGAGAGEAKQSGRPKAPRGASSPYSPYTASNGRKESSPKRSSDTKKPRRGK